MPDPRPKFTSVEQLQEKIDAWHAQRVADNLPLTITSLAIALDTTRDTLLHYEEKCEYFDTITRAKMLCHNYAEDQLFVGRNPSGAQFNLTNNWGWRNKSETEHKIDAVVRNKDQKDAAVAAVLGTKKSNG